MQIFGVTMSGKGGDFLTHYPTTQGQLFKRRLPEFGTMDINADKITVLFKTNGSQQACGFKLYVEKCIGAQ